MIALENAGFRRRQKWIFRNVDLQVGNGRCLAILGPNGRGKTSLIKIIAGLLPLSEGLRQVPRVIGYVPQSFPISLSYRCLDIVVMGRAAAMGVFGSPGAADYRVAEEALDRVGAAAYGQHLLDRLSGGERQLVMLARALATGSELLVLDEPASALDLANQSRLLSVLGRLKAEGRHSILFSTHSPQHAAHVADDVLLMLDDLQSVCGPVAEVLSAENLQRLYGIPVKCVDLAIEGRGTQRLFFPVL